jgi:chaperonin GroEL
MSISTKIRLDEEARNKLKAGVDAIADAVQSTLGPKGLTVLMESRSHVGGVTSTKDGVSVAKQIILEDNVANLGAKVLKEACKRTADNAGDGTTTSIVIARAIVDEGMSFLKKNKNVNVHELVRDLEDQV